MKNFRQKLKFQFTYWVFWLGYFILARLVFIFFNWEKTNELNSISEFGKVFFYGLKIDLSTTGYLLALPTFILILNSFFQKNFQQKVILFYTNILLFIISFFVIMDASVYGHWGNKLDFYSMFYLTNINEALNFVPFLTIILSFLGLAILIIPSYFFYKKKVSPLLQNHQRDVAKTPLILLFLLAFSIIPIRGGVGLNPLNLSNVCFSNNTFANHTSINTMWNMIYTFTERNKLNQTYEYFSKEKVAPLFETLYPTETPSPKLIFQEKPNVIFLILESFTSKLIDNKWNEIEVTPHLNQLTKEGIYFSNFYASGDRTDEGLVSILSGFPAQPISYIINYQNKTAKLPSLISDLKNEDYATSFYYGGDINFANMKSYLLQSGVEKIIDKSDFPAEQFNAKWGVHDHFVFEKLLKDIESAEQPFFKTLLSLSSHPPFDTPIPTVISGNDNHSLFANAANYSDQALGDFFEKLKKSKHWKNTLIVLVADHGISYLDNKSYSDPSKYKIPMIWLGGALQGKTENITKFASQTDIANTLLQELGLPSDDYTYSKNIRSPSSKSFAFYTFNHGYGFLEDKAIKNFDFEAKRFSLFGTHQFTDSIGHAYLQKVSQDFSKN